MRKWPFQGKSQLSISDLAVRRHPCTGGATTALPAPTTVLHDRPPPSCPTVPSVMPDLIGHLELSAGRVYRKTAPHGPPRVNAAPFWPKTAIPPSAFTPKSLQNAAFV